MYNTTISDLICDLRRQIIPTNKSIYKDGEYDGIIFDLHLNLSYYTEKQSYTKRNHAYVLFCGNTNVFYAVENQNENWHLNYKNVPIDRWLNSSNHDSCWRSDGLSFIDDLYFSAAEEINKELIKNKEKDVAPKNMISNSTIGWCGSKMWQLVKVSHQSIKNNDYRRKIVYIKDSYQIQETS